MKIGMVFFKLPPGYNRRFDGAVSSNTLEEKLAGSDFELVRAEVASPGDLDKAVRLFREKGVCGLIFYFRHWTRIALAANFKREINLPLALYAQTGSGYNGVTALTAASAVLREVSDGSGVHVRFLEGMEDDACEWAAAAAGLSKLKSSRLMCWGGFSGADMPYTRSDPDWLESRLVREVMTEQESVLTTKADELAAADSPRIGDFIRWLTRSGVTIREDGTMLSGQSLKRQTALYLAARDRLEELGEENIRGVSLKCHFELSMTIWKCTGCFLPAFLPFYESGGVPSRVVPVSCEGDLNGLVSLMMLHALREDVPPLFGDFVEYGPGYTLLRNCGASSVYWAACSDNASDCLKKTELLPNMHGKSGAAVHYETPAQAEATVCRLSRVKGEFMVFLGKAEILERTPATEYTDPWPHTRVRFPSNRDLLFRAYPCNHASLTKGDIVKRLEYLCGFTGLPVIRLDKDDSLKEYLKNQETS